MRHTSTANDIIRSHPITQVVYDFPVFLSPLEWTEPRSHSGKICTKLPLSFFNRQICFSHCLPPDDINHILRKPRVQEQSPRIRLQYPAPSTNLQFQLSISYTIVSQECLRCR